MSKHTPGPWHFTEKLTASENSNGFRVACKLAYSMATVFPIDQDGKEGEANARLIAAAPELLEAVKRLIGRAAYEGEDATFARAAIAKATGEAA